MQVFLFLLAVLFAIPTFGLSLLAYFGFILLQGWSKAQDRILYADTERAYRKFAGASSRKADNEPLLKRSEDADVFWYSIFKLCDRRKIPRLYSEGLSVDAGFIELVRPILKSLEKDGHSFTSRQIATVDLIERSWDRMTADQKEMVRQAQGDGMTAKMLFKR